MSLHAKICYYKDSRRDESTLVSLYRLYQGINKLEGKELDCQDKNGEENVWLKKILKRVCV